MKNASTLRRVIIGILMVLAAQCGFALEKSPPEKALLPNGLRVIVVEDHSLPMVAMTLYFPIGEGQAWTTQPGAVPLLWELFDRADTRSKSRTDLNRPLEAVG